MCYANSCFVPPYEDPQVHNLSQTLRARVRVARYPIWGTLRQRVRKKNEGFGFRSLFSYYYYYYYYYCILLLPTTTTYYYNYYNY